MSGEMISMKKRKKKRKEKWGLSYQIDTFLGTLPPNILVLSLLFSYLFVCLFCY